MILLSVEKMNVLFFFLMLYWFFQLVAASAIQYQPLYVALANAKRYRTEHQNSNSEDEAQKPRITYLPLSIVLMNQLKQLGHENALSGQLQDMYKKLLEGANYIPSAEDLQKLYQNFPELSKISWQNLYQYLPEMPGLPLFNWSKLNESGEIKSEENLEEAPKWKYLPSYETFNQYFGYAKKAFAVGAFFIPVLGEYEALMAGLQLVDVAWKTAQMYRNGESWSSIGRQVGKHLFGKERRDVSDTMLIDSVEFTYINVSSMDVETFINFVQNMEYPPLSDTDEEIIKNKIANIVDQYLSEDTEKVIDRDEVIEIFEKLVKFIACHGIIPLMK